MSARGWLARLLSAEVRRLTVERDAARGEVRTLGAEVQRLTRHWRAALAEARRVAAELDAAQDAAATAAEHLAHALDERDEARLESGRLRLDRETADRVAGECRAAHRRAAIELERALAELSQVRAELEQARQHPLAGPAPDVEVARLQREVAELRRLAASQEDLLAAAEGRPVSSTGSPGGGSR